MVHLPARPPEGKPAGASELAVGLPATGAELKKSRWIPPPTAPIAIFEPRHLTSAAMNSEPHQGKKPQPERKEGPHPKFPGPEEPPKARPPRP